MSFASYAFALLLGIAVAVRIVCASRGWWRINRASLAAASVVFYAWAMPAHLSLLGYMCLVGHFGPRLIAARAPQSAARRRVLVGVLVAALAPLLVYKYFDYLVAEISLLGLPPLRLVLPLGISFFTFEVVSFAIDVHRGRAVPARRTSDVLLFVGFFPHLVAGPIVRAGEFLYQLDRRRRPRLRVMAEGAHLLIRGFFLKLVIADNLATTVDSSWGAAAAPGANASLGLLVTVGFALQIYCDFEGYTSIARGAAYLLGFRLPPNFNGPYVAATFREFWRRWHMTLSRWLRDYLYVSLGGNRAGRLALYRNLLITMTLGGLWHGAANTFLVWGAVHGVGLVVERALGLQRDAPAPSPVVRGVWFLVVQATVLAAWVFFRSATLTEAFAMLGNIAGNAYLPLTARQFPPVLLLLAGVPVADHLWIFARERWGLRSPSPLARGCWAACMLYAIATARGPVTQFIYFRF